MAEGGHVPADPNTRCTVGFFDALDWKPLSFLDAGIAQKACAVCGTVSRKAVKLPCAHLLCADCHSESAQQGSVCPLDRKDFDERDLDRLELPDLDNYRVTCCNARNGCEFVGPTSSFPDHYKQCAFHVVSCQRCHTAMLRTAVVSHCRDGCSGAPAAPAAPAAPQRRSSRSRDSAEQRHDDLKATLLDISRGMARMHDSVDQVSADVRRVDCRVEWWWKNNCADMRNFKLSVTKGFADEQKVIENVSSDVVAAVRGARWSLAEHVTQELGTQTKKVLSAVEAVSGNLDRFCGPPVYHWYLSGWFSLRLRAMGGSVAISSSPKWMAYGYCVSMYVSFVKDEHRQLRVTCFFNVHPGSNDPQLEWPFSKVFEYGIIHPTNRSLTIGHKTDPKFHKGNFCFQRPREERSGGFAQQALSTAEKLEREEFVVDDMVHMFLVVIP
ncbi:hypothetical protein HPB47_000954 [Ixodes persulcatus]|uniref:Uncharacterized protein n=1 Tax=Ixodes persulcatus TaxID=34615 RepID=A0AC60PQQ1_IXOPE|nr:hypothetical protein HPB47_000954 [Ixodes persulcatus]